MNQNCTKTVQLGIYCNQISFNISLTEQYFALVTTLFFFFFFLIILLYNTFLTFTILTIQYNIDMPIEDYVRSYLVRLITKNYSTLGNV